MRLTLVGVHAEGEIGKVILDGAPEVPGRTVLDRLVHLNTGDDRLRRFCCGEPRGLVQASVNLLLPQTTAEADAGFIVMQPDACHAMSGSNAICVATALLETGRVAMREPETRLVLDTAAGLVPVVAACRAGKCERVRLEMPWSFVVEDGLRLDVPGVGEVEAAIAFGGVFYLLVDVAKLGLAIEPAGARDLVRLGMAALAAARALHHPVHPERPGIEGLAYCMLMGEQDGRLLNATVMPPGRIDRSPCGTGSSARLALLHARGGLADGAEAVFHSITGGRFEAGIGAVGEVAGRAAIRPWISGRGWLFSREEIFAEPSDPFAAGHMVSDLWGDLA